MDGGGGGGGGCEEEGEKSSGRRLEGGEPTREGSLERKEALNPPTGILPLSWDKDFGL